MPHCSRGRLDERRIEKLNVCERKLECWEAFIHFGVLYRSAEKGRITETTIQNATSILTHHYNVSGGNANRSVTKMSKRLRNADDKLSKWLFTSFEKHKQFWMDKGQDIILEYGPEAQGPKAGSHIRNLEVPIDLRTLLDLEHSHITMNPADSGPLIDMFEQFQKSKQGYVE